MANLSSFYLVITDLFFLDYCDSDFYCLCDHDGVIFVNIVGGVFYSGCNLS